MTAIAAPWWSTVRTAAGIASYDRRAQNKSKVLASAWNVLDPIATMLAYYFLLVKVFGLRDEGFIFFLFLSITVHKFAMQGLGRGTSAFVRYKSLVVNGTLPNKAVVVYASLIEMLMDLGFGLLIFFASVLLMGTFTSTPHVPTPSVHWVLLPVLLFGLVAFAAGCIYLLSCVAIYWRDLTNLVQMATRVLLFACPVLYSIDRFQDNEGALAIYMLNPLACYYHMIRGVVLEERWPEPTYLLTAAAFTVGLLVVGRFVFWRLEGRIGKYW
ncbi:MAG: ABC transporter permease [Phycisphaerales bacterium]